MRIIRFALIALLCLVPVFASASQTDGTIDATYKYAWGNDFGWINLGTSGGDVHVTDAGLTGYAWSANYGWINLAPTEGGVKNDGNGNLSGYAWSTVAGYINFSGITITDTGLFTGAITTPQAGTLTFDCSECEVLTDWRPASVRNSGGGGSSGGGGGGSSVSVSGGGSPPASPPPSSVSSSVPILPTTSCGIADFNCDGRVNLIDLSILLSHYGQSVPVDSPYNLDHSGVVDFPDLSILMYYWTG
jgi:hypothetical protein